MATTYIIKEIHDNQEWDYMVSNSVEGSIFLLSIYLENFGAKYRRIGVYKGEELKAGLVFCYDQKKIIQHDLLIYAGIIFPLNPEEKKVNSYLHKFNITQELVGFLTENYDEITLQFSPFFEDYRPFLWHNYNLGKKFSLNLRYTSILNISDLDTFFNGMEASKQRRIRQAQKKNIATFCSPDTKLFCTFYNELMRKQQVNKSGQEIQDIENLITILMQNSMAKIFYTKENERIIYSSVWLFDHKYAYYMFGAPNPNEQESYQGTINIWHSLKELHSMGYYNIDLEGINSPHRGWFKLSFGGDILPYFEVKY